MASSKIKGFWKQQPTKAATDAVDVLTFPFSFNPTSATQISLGTLPNGARPIEVTCFDGDSFNGRYRGFWKSRGICRDWWHCNRHHKVYHGLKED